MKVKKMLSKRIFSVSSNEIHKICKFHAADIIKMIIKKISVTTDE